MTVEEPFFSVRKAEKKGLFLLRIPTKKRADWLRISPRVCRSHLSCRTPSDRCLRHIILPLLRPTIITVCTINLIGGMKCFDLLYTMTKGGPGTATQSTTIYIYKEMFTNSHYGYSAAMSMILFIVSVFVSMLFLRMTKNKN